MLFRSGSPDDQASAGTAGALGLGAGAQISYLVTNTFSLTGELGLDQYFGGGKATNQAGPTAERPGTVLRALLGVKYRF